MAERIVSPGVFTRERDLSFLPTGVANIDAVIVGPTLKGPSFVPTQVTSMTEFESVFGSFSSEIYTPYTVNEYLRSAGSVKVVRVGYLGGYKVSGFNLVVSGALGNNFTLKPHRDFGTECGVNILLSDESVPINIEGVDYHYSQALINLQKEHSVVNDSKERIILKFSIPDKPFEQVAKEINYVVPYDLSS